MKKAAVTIPLEVLENPVVSLQTKIVYCVICTQLKHGGGNGLIYDDLAVKCGLTRKKLIQSIQELVDRRLVADHPSLHDNSLRREIRLGEITDWNEVVPSAAPRTKKRPPKKKQPKQTDEPASEASEKVQKNDQSGTDSESADS
jgi:hypothetical protein